jgi:hypothetical protein
MGGCDKGCDKGFDEGPERAPFHVATDVPRAKQFFSPWKRLELAGIIWIRRERAGIRGRAEILKAEN